MSQVPASADTGERFGTEEWAMSAAIALVWGSSFLLIAIAIDYVATPVVPMARLFFGTIALLVIPSARKRIERSDYKRVVFLGLVWMAIPFMLYPMAEQSVSSAVAGMINGGLPIVTVAVTAVFVRRRPSSQRIISVFIGFLGITIISLSSIRDGVSASVHGVVYLLIALLCYAIAVNTAQPLQAKYGSLTTMLWIEVCALIWTLPLGIPALWRSEFNYGALCALAVLGALGTGMSFVVYGTLLNRAGPVRGMIGTFFTPIVATVLGILFRDEEIHPIAIAGMFIVICGAVLTSRPERTVSVSATPKR